MKKIKKFILFSVLYFLCISNLFSFDANLQIDKQETDINESINLRLEVNSDSWGEIRVSQIIWLENFDVVNQSQSQSSSSNIEIINWKTETRTMTKIYLDLLLNAKTKWSFEIWPAIIKNWAEEVRTNIVKIDVSGEDLFINNSWDNIQIAWNNNQNTWSVDQNTWAINHDDTIEDYEDAKKLNFNDDKSLYLLFGVLVVVLLQIYYIIKTNPDILEKLFNKNEEEEDANPKNKQVKNIEPIKKDIIKKVEIKDNAKPKVLDEKIIYPNISDINFITKINDIFKQKLNNKYLVGNIENKTYEEILQYVDLENKEKVKNIVQLLIKAKYSNTNLDNKKILELVENFNNNF